METYKCTPCDRIITKSNKLNHENTEFYKNNSLNKDNPPTTLVEPSFKTYISCNRVKNRNDFYDFHVICEDCNKKIGDRILNIKYVIQ
jgi:hypothetical protein